LQEFLRNLGGSLAAVGVQQKSLHDLQAVAHLFEPFKDFDLGQLTDFLKRAAEYRSGEKLPVAAVPGLADVTTASCQVSEAVHALGVAEMAQVPDRESHITKTREVLQTALKTVGEHFGLTLTFKENKKWLPNLSKKVVEKHAGEMAEAAKLQAAEAAKAAIAKPVAAFQQLRSQITTHESYQSDVVKAAIHELAATDVKILKSAAGELGASGASGGRPFDGNKYIESVLMMLTGVAYKTPKPAKVKATKATVPDAPVEQVDAIVKSLQDMLDKTKDPDAVPDSEIDAILNRVSSEFSETQQKAIAKQVTGKGGRSGKGAIDYLRADLTAVKRALGSQKV
jgi:hypothetical protein